MAYQDKNDETVPRGGGNVSGKSAMEIPKGGGNVSGKDATENSTETMQAQPTNTTEPQPRTISDKS